MKSYRGYVEEGRARVTGRATGSPWSIVHHKKYSDADLLNWGTDENLGKDLARSLLLDAFGLDSCNDIECFCENKWVEPTYEKFYAEVVSKLKEGEEWRMTQNQICDFAFDNVTDEKVESLV